MTCPKCKKCEVCVELEVSGGCQGHDADEYCYCDSPNAALVLRCAGRQLKRGEKPCGWKHRPYSLQDSGSIERFIRDILKPEDYEVILNMNHKKERWER